MISPYIKSLLTLFLKFWAASFFSLPRNGSERNSDSLLLYFFHGTEFRVIFSSAEVFGTEFRVVFSSAEGFGTEFRGFLFRGTAGIPSEITICSVCSVFRGIIFLSEIPNPNYCSVPKNVPVLRFAD
jgi:hypothetical protein